MRVGGAAAFWKKQMFYCAERHNENYLFCPIWQLLASAKRHNEKDLFCPQKKQPLACSHFLLQQFFQNHFFDCAFFHKAGSAYVKNVTMYKIVFVLFGLLLVTCVEGCCAERGAVEHVPL